MAKLHVTTTINGEPTEFLCESHQSVLDVLRGTLGPVTATAAPELPRSDHRALTVDIG